MNILALGDPHGVLPKNLNSLIKNNKIEVIICTGDVAPAPVIPKRNETFLHACKRAEKTYKKIIDKLCSFNLPVLTLRGNVFTNTKRNNEITNKIFAPYENLYHKNIGSLNVKNCNFIFFDMVYEKSTLRDPSKFTKRLELTNSNKELRLNKLLKKEEESIIISHNPPYGVLDKISSGKHVGSKILLDAIIRYNPKLVLCGHIHESKGIATIGQTIVYNLGYKGSYKIIRTLK